MSVENLSNTPPPPDFWTILIVFLISSISIVTSIIRRIYQKHAVNKLWVVGEYTAGILAGYLVYDAYPIISSMKYFPEFMTMPICVATAAHSGGRFFQTLEVNYRKKLIELLQKSGNDDK